MWWTTSLCLHIIWICITVVILLFRKIILAQLLILFQLPMPEPHPSQTTRYWSYASECSCYCIVSKVGKTQYTKWSNMEAPFRVNTIHSHFTDSFPGFEPLNSMVSNHNIHYLQALYIEGQDLKIYRETQQFPQWATVWRQWREKTPSLTGRYLENQTPCGLDRLGSGGEERRGEVWGKEGREETER